MGALIVPGSSERAVANVTTRILITAGPTHEAIDAVRYIGNRSSGRLGVALAEAARDAGWEVTLLLGPVCTALPTGVRLERFTSTDDLAELLDRYFPACDVLMMAAAVADFRPSRPLTGKHQRTGNFTLELESTPDLLAEIARQRTTQHVVGFALDEPARLDERAREKLRSKSLDAIVANPLDTMDSTTIVARVLTSDGRVHTPPSGKPISKAEFARWLVAWMKDRWSS